MFGFQRVVTSECTALLGRRLGFGGVFGQWLQLVCCANLLAAGPSISIINVYKFGNLIGTEVA